MTRRKKIYEGKAKILYEGPEPGTLIQYFKDDTTAFDATKKAVLEGKGVINNRISEYIMTRLNSIGVQNHFIKRLNLREQLIREVEIIPLEVVCRNIAAGSLSTRFGRMLQTRLRADVGSATLRPAYIVSRGRFRIQGARHYGCAFFLSGGGAPSGSNR